MKKKSSTEQLYLYKKKKNHTT